MEKMCNREVRKDRYTSDIQNFSEILNNLLLIFILVTFVNYFLEFQY